MGITNGSDSGAMTSRDYAFRLRCTMMTLQLSLGIPPLISVYS